MRPFHTVSSSRIVSPTKQIQVLHALAIILLSSIFPEDSGGDVSISSVESVHSFTVRAIVYDLLT